MVNRYIILWRVEMNYLKDKILWDQEDLKEFYENRTVVNNIALKF